MFIDSVTILAQAILAQAILAQAWLKELKTAMAT